MASRPEITIPPPIVALASWVVPGAGYLLIRQWARGLTIGITILTLFIGGLLVGGVRVVDAPVLAGIETARDVVTQKPWFIGQILAGPISIASAYIAHNANIPLSHGRANEIGTLYTAIAGMLNLLAIIDSAYRAGHMEPKR